MPSTRPAPRPASADMRALGLDLGSKRIGVAVSDSDGTLAMPIEVLERSVVAGKKGARQLAA